MSDLFTVYLYSPENKDGYDFCHLLNETFLSTDTADPCPQN